MVFFLALMLALFTRSFLNSRLCKGDYGFTKTYFGYGLGGVILISIAVFWILGPLLFAQDHGNGSRTLFLTFRAWTLMLAFYMTGVGLAILRIRENIKFPLMNLYMIILLVCIAIFLLFAVYVAWLYLAVYAVATFILYKFYWREFLFQRQGCDLND